MIITIWDWSFALLLISMIRWVSNNDSSFKYVTLDFGSFFVIFPILLSKVNMILTDNLETRAL